MANHKQAAIRNMKMVDDLVHEDDEDHLPDAVLAGASVLMHCLLYMGDSLHEVAEAIDRIATAIDRAPYRR